MPSLGVSQLQPINATQKRISDELLRFRKATELTNKKQSDLVAQPSLGDEGNRFSDIEAAAAESQAGDDVKLILEVLEVIDRTITQVQKLGMSQFSNMSNVSGSGEKAMNRRDVLRVSGNNHVILNTSGNMRIAGCYHIIFAAPGDVIVDGDYNKIIVLEGLGGKTTSSSTANSSAPHIKVKGSYNKVFGQSETVDVGPDAWRNLIVTGGRVSRGGVEHRILENESVKVL